MSIPLPKQQSDDVSIEVITPGIAREYLARNMKNRNLREQTALTYALDMERGDWSWNGEAIKFAQDGTLLDGQHRLYAITLANKPIRMLVIRNLPNETQHTMDTGVRRTLPDVLKLRGEVNYVQLAATLRGIYNWESGIRRFGGGAKANGATNTQLLRLLDQYPWIREGMPLVCSVQAGCSLPSSIAGPLWWVFVQIDADDASHFFARLASDEDHHTGEPIYTLRKSLRAMLDSVRGQRNATYMAAITIKAWNKYRAGEEASLLKWTAGGAHPEKFPEPK